MRQSRALATLDRLKQADAFTEERQRDVKDSPLRATMQCVANRVSHRPRFDFRNSTLRHRYDSVKYVVKRPLVAFWDMGKIGALGCPTPP